MCLYSCQLENRDGSSDRFELGDFEDQDAAVNAARTALLVSLSGRSVELFRERDLVGRFGRDVAQFRDRKPPLRMAGRG